MGKKVTSPFDSFSGYVVIPDPLTYPQFIKLQKLFGELGEFEQANATPQEINFAVAGVIFPMCEEWGIESVTNDPMTFPCAGSDFKLLEADKFIQWLMLEYVALFRKVEESKNE